MEVDGWVPVSLVNNGFFLNRPKIVLLVLLFWCSRPCVFCVYVYTLSKVASHDLSVLSMSVMVTRVSKTSLYSGAGGCNEFHTIFIWIFLTFLTLQSPITYPQGHMLFSFQHSAKDNHRLSFFPSMTHSTRLYELGEYPN